MFAQEIRTVTERVAREHKGEPNIGSMSLSATPQLDPRTGQRLSEEYGGDLDTVLKVADTLRPEGPLQICGETMLGDFDSSCTVVLGAKGADCKVGQPDIPLRWRWAT